MVSSVLKSGGTKIAAFWPRVDYLCLERLSRSQCLVTQWGISILFFRLYIWRLWRSQDVQYTGAFPILTHVGLMVQLKRYALVAHGANYYAVAAATLPYEHVVAHHSLTTRGDPKTRGLQRQDSPPKIRLTRIISRKTATRDPGLLSPGRLLLPWDDFRVARRPGTV
jgi:hypothetical protein